MAYIYKFIEEEVTELLGDDLSLAASLATLINKNGDIRAFLVKKLEEREEELAMFHLSQAPQWIDETGFKESLDMLRAVRRLTY